MTIHPQPGINLTVEQIDAETIHATVTKLGPDVNLQVTAIQPRSEEYELGYLCNGIFMKAKKVDQTDAEETNKFSKSIHDAILKEDPIATDFQIELGTLRVVYKNGQGQRQVIDLDGTDPFFQKHPDLIPLQEKIRTVSRSLMKIPGDPFYYESGKNHSLFGSNTQISHPKFEEIRPHHFSEFFKKSGWFRKGESHFDRIYQHLSPEQQKSALERVIITRSYTHHLRSQIAALIKSEKLKPQLTDKEREKKAAALKELQNLLNHIDQLEPLKLYTAAPYMPSYSVDRQARADLLQAAHQAHKNQEQILRTQIDEGLGLGPTLTHFSIETGGVLIFNRSDRIDHSQLNGKPIPEGASVEGFIARQVMTLQSPQPDFDFSFLDNHFDAQITEALKGCLVQAQNETQAKIAAFAASTVLSSSASLDQKLAFLQKSPDFSKIF